jgi:hypothetical protein
MARVPIIHQSAAEQMTANVLKRIDPDIEELLASAGHVALYNFDIPTKRWSRKDVEGSLFLVRRQSHPRFQLIILNKKSAVATETFVENVHGGFQCEVQKPYLLYRNSDNQECINMRSTSCYFNCCSVDVSACSVSAGCRHVVL